MKIGYWFAGYLLPNKIAADGCYHIRDSLIKTLTKLNHEVITLSPIRDKKELADQYPDSPYHMVLRVPSDFHDKQESFSKYDGEEGKTKKWYFGEVHERRLLPNVDIVIVEINIMGLQGYDIMSLLEHYTNLGIKCFLWDIDCWGKRYENIPSEFHVNEKLVYFLTPYRTKIYQQQIEFYYGYDHEKEYLRRNDIFNHVPFVYVGNDYYRGKKMIKFYKDLNVDIYGNFKKDKENITELIGKNKFKGPLEPSKVVEIMHQHFATIQVVRKEYEKIGLHTQRINEASYAGLVCFIDSDIKNAQDMIPADQLVNSGVHAGALLEDMINNHEIEDRVRLQRSMLPTYGDQVNKIFSLQLL